MVDRFNSADLVALRQGYRLARSSRNSSACRGSAGGAQKIATKKSVQEFVMRVIAAFLVTLFLASQARAAEYYVYCGSGSDAAGGTAAAPWKTLGYAFDAIAGGDVLNIRGSGADCTLSDSTDDLIPAGSSGAPTTIQGWPGHESTTTITGCIRETEGLLVEHVQIRNLTINGGIWWEGLGTEPENRTEGLIFRGLTITGGCNSVDVAPDASNFSGIYLNDATAPLIEDNTITGISTAAANCFSTGYCGAGIKFYNVDGAIIRHNTISTSAVEALAFKQNVDDSEVYRNRLLNNTVGVYYCNQLNCNDNVAYENIVSCATSGYYGFYLKFDTDDTTIRNNTVLYCNSAVSVIGPEGTDYSERSIIRDNIFWDDGVGTGEYWGMSFERYDQNEPTTLNYNVYCNQRVVENRYGVTPVEYNTFAANFATWKTNHGTFDANSTTTCPSFVDFAGGDYRLAQGSSGKGVGTSGADIGAYPRGMGANYAPIGRRTALAITPGLVGFGTKSEGPYSLYGRGVSQPTVYKVTTLSTSGAGSLWTCVGTNYQFCIFETSGKVTTTTDLNVDQPGVRVLGETAPAPGFVTQGISLRIRAHDSHMSHLRNMPSDAPGSPAAGSRDGIAIESSANKAVYNSGMNHMSVAFSIDEGLGFYSNSGAWEVQNVYVNNSIIAEGLYDSIQGPHSMGIISSPVVGPVTLYGNLVHSNFDRNPHLQAGTRFEVINNVFSNWGSSSNSNLADLTQSNAAAASYHNFKGNTWRTGPARGLGADSYSANRSIHSYEQDTGTKLYVLGNVGPGRTSDTGDEWNIATSAWTSTYRSTPEAFTGSGISQMTAANGYDYVLANAGWRNGARDALDTRYVEETIAQDGVIIDDDDDVGGPPSYATTTRTLTTPDSPHTVITDPANAYYGYTNLEAWLDSYRLEVEEGQPPSPPPMQQDARLLSRFPFRKRGFHR